MGKLTKTTAEVERDLLEGLDNQPKTTIAWNDLRFPAQAINPVGIAADPARNVDTGLLEFSGTIDNVIMGVAQMPHDWKLESTINPHIHIVFPTANALNSRWKLEYNIGNINGNFANALGTWTDGGTITVQNPNNTLLHSKGHFANIVMTGKTLSSVVLWKVTRLANSDAADDYTGIVTLLEFDIHYQKDGLGSRTVSAK